MMENNICNASKRLPWIVQNTFNAKFIGHIWRAQQLEEIAKKIADKYLKVQC